MCLKADQEQGRECSGFLFDSAEYPELLHCNNCGSYYARNRSPNGWPPLVHVRRGQLDQYERRG